MIRCGIMAGKACTGNRLVDYMLKKIARFEDHPVVVDGQIVTAKDTVDSPPGRCVRRSNANPGVCENTLWVTSSELRNTSSSPELTVIVSCENERSF